MGDKPVHLFTTELANQAIQVVKIDRFQNIVAFHCSLEETKRFLSNFAQVQQNSQNSLPKQQNIGSLDGGKLGGCTNDMQGQILAPATTSGGRKFAPPPNVKLENPMQPPTPTGGFKREYSSLSSPFSDPPPLNILSGPLTPYGGGDTSNLPITDTHFGNYTSNGDPLEKMARLTQEALPYDPPLKQPKLEPNEACGGVSKSNAAGAVCATSNTVKNCASDSIQLSASCDDQLTPSQRQHRLERLQTIEGLKLKKGTRFPQQPMPNFMPVMQCVAPPNVSLDVGMMPQSGPNINPSANQASNFAARAMTPPNFVGGGQTGPPSRLVVGQPPIPMMQMPGPPPPPSSRSSADGGPPPPVVNEKRSRTPRSSTPKNKNVGGSGGNNQTPAGAVGPTTMMVQGKPAVMVHPNQTTKSSRTTNRSNSASFPPQQQDKFFAAGGNGGPPNVTFGDPNFSTLGDNFQSQQQQNVAQIMPDHYHNQNAFFQNGGAPPPSWNAPPTFCPSSNNPAATAAAAATLVFNHPGGGPRAAPPPANLNLNMNIQINAQPPATGGGGGQDLMMGGGTGGGGHPMAGQHGMQSSVRFMAPGGNDFMASRVDDEIFYDPTPFGNRGGGQGLCPPPPNVNIAVTGIYPPSQQQGPPRFTGNQMGAAVGPMSNNNLSAQNASYFQCNTTNNVDSGQDFGGQIMMNNNNEPPFFQQQQQSNNFSTFDASCRPNDLTFQQRKTSMPPGSFTMSIHHNLNMQNGPYNPMSPQMAPWPQQQQLCRPQSQGAPPQQPGFATRGAAPLRPQTTTFDDFQKLSPQMPPSSVTRNAAAAGPLSDPQNVQQQYDAQYKNFQQQLYSNNNNGPTST